MKHLYIAILLLLFTSFSEAKCTPEQFNEEYKTFASAQLEYLKAKKAQLDEQLEKVKAKNGLTDKATFEYRITLLQDESTLTIKKKEPDINLLSLAELKQKGKCGKLMSYHKDFVKLADKQWDIIFKNLSNELSQNGK